jgi:hypothetical protein
MASLWAAAVMAFGAPSFPPADVIVRTQAHPGRKCGGTAEFREVRPDLSEQHLRDSGSDAGNFRQIQTCGNGLAFGLWRRLVSADSLARPGAGNHRGHGGSRGRNRRSAADGYDRREQVLGPVIAHKRLRELPSSLALIRSWRRLERVNGLRSPPWNGVDDCQSGQTVISPITRGSCRFI